MTLLAVNLTLIEFIALPLVATIFGGAVYFFLKSRQSLRETMNEADRKQSSFINSKIESQYGNERRSVPEPKEFSRPKYEAPVIEREPQVHSKQKVEQEENIVQQLKSTIAQQQKVLNTYLEKVEELENK